MPNTSERAPTEVWIERVSPNHCYLRIGDSANLGTINAPHDSAFALWQRDSAQRFFDQEGERSAKENVLHSNNSTQDNKGVTE